MSASLSTRQIWSMPIALALVSAAGLISALLGDRIWDVLSWMALAEPVVVICVNQAELRERNYPRLALRSIVALACLIANQKMVSVMDAEQR